MPKQKIMTINSLEELLEELKDEVGGEYSIWLSSDEEGNEFLPMLEDTKLCLGIDKQVKRIVFFPSHR